MFQNDNEFFSQTFWIATKIDTKEKEESFESQVKIRLNIGNSL